jgi:hypothetical protein
MSNESPQVHLNQKGQCPACNKKPLIYKRKGTKFCARCCRQFDIDTGAPTENFAWKRADAGFVEV